MSRHDFRDTRMRCEAFYLRNPEFAKDPCAHPDPDVVVVKQFKVASYDEASDFIDELNTDVTRTYYYRIGHSRGDIGLWHADGVCTFGFNDVDEWFASRIVKHRIAFKKLKKANPKEDLYNNVFQRMRYNRDRRILLTKVAKIRKASRCKFLRALVQAWVSTCDWCEWWLWDKWANKWREWRWDRRNLKYWKKNNHALDEFWSLEMHILKDLKWNLKRINEEGYSINTEFMYDVLRQEHPEESNEDINKRMDKIMVDADRNEAERVEKAAVKLQKETYEHIRHLIDLYTFYVNQEIDDEDAFTSSQRTSDMQPILMKNTYDMLDYKAMLKKGNETWNEILDLVKKYGQQMSD